MIIVILGDTGSGKSRAIKDLDPKETVLLTPNRKELPWKGSNKDYNEVLKNRFFCDSFAKARAFIQNINDKKPEVKQIILDDISHTFTSEQSAASFINNSAGGGFQKWQKLGMDVIHAIIETDKTLRPDLKIIILGHTDTDNNTGKLKMKVAGKLLEDHVQLPSYTNWCLITDCVVTDGKPEYRLITNKDGSYLGSMAKSLEGALEMYEPNSLKVVLEKIDKYFE